MNWRIFHNLLKCEHPNHLLSLFWKLQVKGNLFVCPQIWIVASLTYKQLKCVTLWIFYFQIFFLWEGFFIFSIFFKIILFWKCSVIFHWNWIYMANHRDVSFKLWVQKLRDKLNKRKTKLAVTCSFQKVIWTLKFSYLTFVCRYSIYCKQYV